MLSSELANFLLNISERAQFSCWCFTVYLHSTTIVTRLTKHDDVIKLLLRGALHPEVLHWAPHLLGPALHTRFCWLFAIQSSV